MYIFRYPETDEAVRRRLFVPVLKQTDNILMLRIQNPARKNRLLYSFQSSCR